MFKSLIKVYRQSDLSTRIMLFAATILLTAVVSWVNQLNVFLVTSSVAAGGILLELLLTRTRKMVLVFLWVANLFLLGVYTYSLFIVYSGFFKENDAIWVAGTIGFTGLLTTIISGVLVYKLVGGRTWVHTGIVFALYYITMTALLIWLRETNLLLTAGGVLLIVCLYPLLGWYTKRQKHPITPFPDLPSNRNITSLTSNVKTLLSNMNPVNTGIKGVYGFTDSNKILLCVSLAGEHHTGVVVEHNEILVDGEDYAWVLEYLTYEAGKYSKSRKIRKSRIVPVVVVNHHNLSRRVSPVKVRKRTNPDKVLGQVLVAKKSAISKLASEQLLRKGLTKKELAKL